MFQSQPRKIVRKTLSQKNPPKKGLVEQLKVQALSSNPSTIQVKLKCLMPLILAFQEAEVKRITIPGQLRKIVRPHLNQ
jgi:hypothetical protein